MTSFAKTPHIKFHIPTFENKSTTEHSVFPKQRTKQTAEDACEPSPSSAHNSRRSPPRPTCSRLATLRPKIGNPGRWPHGGNSLQQEKRHRPATQQEGFPSQAEPQPIHCPRVTSANGQKRTQKNHTFARNFPTNPWTPIFQKPIRSAPRRRFHCASLRKIKI